MKRQKKALLTFSCFLLLLSFCSLILAMNTEPPETSISSPREGGNIRLEKIPLLGSTAWNNYQITDEEKLKELKLKSAKAIFFLIGENGRRFYVVSRKKHLKRRSDKDNKWEFPGGKIDKKEALLPALIREVKEEDESNLLAIHIERLHRERSAFLSYKILRLKDSSLHAIFIFSLTTSEYLTFKKFHDANESSNYETYGFELIGEKFLNTGKDHKANREFWTPKSVKLLKALRNN